MAFSEKLSHRVCGAVKGYFATFRQKSAPIDSAQRHYWNTLDQCSGILLTLLEGIGTDSDPMGCLDFGESINSQESDPWTKAVRAAARAAYDHVCPRQNPRQLQAYAAGLRVLYPISKKAKAVKGAR